MKVLSIAVPCYNSAAYMDHCIETLLHGGDEVEILIVDDGSVKDNTAEIADRYDYQANPTMYIGQEKIYESHLFEKKDECRMHVEEVFRRAMAD